MARSLKQQKADFERIKFETKTVKQATKIISSQYEKIGRKVPKKILEGRATKSDINRYRNTIENSYNREILKKDFSSSHKISSLYNKLSDIQQARTNVVKDMLQGYDNRFVKGFLKGQKAVLGKNISYEISSTKLPSFIEIDRLAKQNGISVEKYLKNEIKALSKDLMNLKENSNNSKSVDYMMGEIKKLIETQGHTFSEANEDKIKRSLATLDFLGFQKLSSIISTKLDNLFYEIYKKLLKMLGNRDLVISIMEDISKSRKSKLIDHVRLIE